MPRKRPLTQLATENSVVSQKRARNNKHNESQVEKRAGTIIQIILKNFMCHSLFEVNLTSNINFITGRNGSGKSAILTALVVGLGAKASTTNRGTSIKNFIKEGKNSASVEIIINNSGEMAYKPSIYGNQITIQRNFTAGGSSSYKIKSSTGTVISTLVKEIQRITVALNIQVDNPVCILNQDTARNFLTTSDPKQKFILFMRATKLEDLFIEYKNSVQCKNTAIQKQKDKEKEFNELKEKQNELKKKIEDHQSIAKLKDKLILYQRELLWAKVRDVEQEVHEQESLVEKHQQKYDEINDNIVNRAQKLQEIKDRVNDLNRQIVELKEATEVQSRPQRDVQNMISELTRKFNDKRKEKRAIENTIGTKMKDCEALQKEIDNFTSNLSQIEQEKLKRLKDIGELGEKIKHIQNILETTSNDLFQMRSNDNRTDNNERDLQKELEQINRQHDITREHLSSLKSDSNNNLLIYGKDMPRLVAAINASKQRFSQMPRGPLGSHINIKDKKWAVAVEGFLGPGLLQSFAVDNRKDNALLMEIFNNHWQGAKPTVITSKFFSKVHDISRNYAEAPRDCVNMYDALDIADPVVANFIIDQASVEGILLVPSTEKAIELMSNSARVPKNCKQSITITGDRYYPDPNYKMYASRYKRAQYLKVNPSDLISQYEERIQDFDRKRKTIESQRNALRKERQEQQTKIHETVAKLNKLKQAYSAMKVKMNELKSTAEPEVANIQTLETEMAELKQLIEQNRADVGQVETSMKEIKDEISAKESQLRNLQEASQGLADRLIPLEQQIREEGSKRDDLNVNDNFERKRLADCKKRLEDTRLELQQKQTIVEQQTREAQTVGERLDEIRQVPEIVSSISEQQRRIRKLQSDVEPVEETKRKYEQTNEMCQQAAELMMSLQNSIDELRQAVDSRKRHYKITEDYFVNFLDHNFQKILEFRQFKGKLEVDMKEKQLHMQVIPQQGSQGHTATTNLSGGEKSFSTVAFLYSLWQCLEFPFYFLDEFDVFMDTVNRSRVMEILIHHAKNKPDLQFVFLTPQGLSCINDDTVAIHKLDDPERRSLTQ